MLIWIYALVFTCCVCVCMCEYANFLCACCADNCNRQHWMAVSIAQHNTTTTNFAIVMWNSIKVTYISSFCLFASTALNSKNHLPMNALVPTNHTHTHTHEKLNTNALSALDCAIHFFKSLLAATHLPVWPWNGNKFISLCSCKETQSGKNATTWN